MIRRVGITVSAALIASASGAVAVAPGTAEVRDEAGAVVAAFTGLDAVQDAVSSVVTGRAPEARPWTILVGTGTYGDFAVATPNLAVAADAGAAVVISGVGIRDDTGGGCVAITRGNVGVAGLTCSAPSRTGVSVTLRNSEGGVSLGSLTIDRAGEHGIAVTGGRGVVITAPTITDPARDGIHLALLTARTASPITGGAITRAGRDGLRLADDVRGVSVTGLSIIRAARYGIASEDAGNSDASFSGVTVTGSGRDGVLLGGGTLRATVVSSTITGSTGAGVRLGEASGLRITGIPVDGSNAGGDLVFDAAVRTGGAYDGLRAPDGMFALVGEPAAVRVSGVPIARAAVVAGGPAGLARRGPAVMVGATARVAGRRVVLRFPAGASVYRRSGGWTPVAASRRVRGAVQAALGTSLLGTARSVYASFG